MKNSIDQLFYSGVDEKPSFRGFRANDRLAYKKAVSDWCLRCAKSALNKHMLEESLRWSLLSAGSLAFDCDPLTYPDLERHLLDCASLLPATSAGRQRRPDGRRCWLHVFDEVFPYGGHTAMAVRWMQLDQHRDRHCAILLNQEGTVPDSLRLTVERTDGEIKQLVQTTSLVAKALALREYAWAIADVVVLHIRPDNILATVAFGIPEGPPILFVNHAAHKFWMGGCIADLVLNCRGSEYEREWTMRFRGIEEARNATLPIPLPPVARDAGLKLRSERSQLAAKTALSLPEESKVILTVGSGYKYVPLPGLSFFEAATSILQSCQDAVLLAVGAEENKLWKRLREKTNGRATAVGVKTDLRVFHEATDLYLEGIPVGSTTALLEAAIQGIPCVLAPSSVPPPFGSDGSGLDHLYRPTSVSDYVSQVVKLLQDDDLRKTMGWSNAKMVACHHAKPGWIKYLNDVRLKIPREHRVYSVRKCESPPRYSVGLWTAFLSRIDSSDVFTATVRKAVYLGLNPKPDAILERAVTSARRVRRPRLSQNPVILSLICRVISILPGDLKVQVYELLSYYLRPGGRIFRTSMRLIPRKILTRYFAHHLLP